MSLKYTLTNHNLFALCSILAHCTSKRESVNIEYEQKFTKILLTQYSYCLQLHRTWSITQNVNIFYWEFSYVLVRISPRWDTIWCSGMLHKIVWLLMLMHFSSGSSECSIIKQENIANIQIIISLQNKLVWLVQ